MAKRRTTQSAEKRDLVKTCAFWGLAISAIMYVISGVITLLIKFIQSLNGTKTAAVLSQISGIVTLIASIALVIAIAIPAYGYVKGRSKGWKIFYWLALVIYVLGVVFGIIPTLL